MLTAFHFSFPSNDSVTSDERMKRAKSMSSGHQNDQFCESEVIAILFQMQPKLFLLVVF